ncbi:flavodoxin domain-containing protein [Sphingomonas sp. MMS24-JH45]
MDESFKGGAAPQDKVVILVTATYNGRAPDSAVAVERALDAGLFDDADWSGARVAVLGIGNSQWPNYQVFPKRVAAAVEKAGATILVPRAEADGQGDFDGSGRRLRPRPVEGARRGQRTRRRDRIAEPRPIPCRRYPRPRAARTRAAAGDRRQRRTRPPRRRPVGLREGAAAPLDPPDPHPPARGAGLSHRRPYRGLCPQPPRPRRPRAVAARRRSRCAGPRRRERGAFPPPATRPDGDGARQLLTDFVELSDAASRRAVAQLGSRHGARTRANASPRWRAITTPPSRASA